MSLMTSMWTQTLAQASRMEERAHFLFTPHVESDIKHVVKKNMAHQSRDVSGWDFEKKVSVLAELQDMIEAPCFKYVDWGETVPAKAKGVALLPLILGQEALLDLWAYIMEYCDVVPARTGARGLFLRLGGCICRRLEFVNGVETNGMPLKMDPTIEARYFGLLNQSLQYCAAKLAKSRILTQDHAYFSSHIYTAAFYRSPSVAAPLIMRAIEAYSAKLEETDTAVKGTRHGRSSSVTAVDHCWLSPRDSAKSPCTAQDSSVKRQLDEALTEAPVEDQSPQPEDHPHSHDEGESLPPPASIETRREAAVERFRLFRDAVGTALGAEASPEDERDAADKPRHSPARLVVQSTPWATLDAIFQAGLDAATPDDEAAFVRQSPHLYMDTPQLGADAVTSALAPFLDRLKTPSRDSILFVVFLATFVEDSSTMLFHRQPPSSRSTWLWQCVPGYFVCVKAFVNVFKKVCLRRIKARDAHIVTKDADVVINPWFPYWTTNELEPVYDGLGDLLANGALLNVFVQVILESTNMYDPHSVDYSFNVLQNVFETAATCHPHHDHPHRSGAATTRGYLPAEFDLHYYLAALRQALTSAHFQILLKVLAFVYATADLLDSKRRQKLLAGVVLHENFFPLFLHWNEEVRRMFCHLLVYKLFLSSRLDLPLVSDRVLLASSPFFRPQHEPAPHVLQGIASYFAPAPVSTKKLSPQAVADDHNQALERLIMWDTTATPRQSNQKQKQERLFRESLSNDDLMLDLSVTSKLDAVLKMIAEQIHAHDDGTSPSGLYFPRHLQVYAQKALSQYVGLLWIYYKVAFDDLSVPPSAPTLEFNVQNFFGSND